MATSRSKKAVRTCSHRHRKLFGMVMIFAMAVLAAVAILYFAWKAPKDNRFVAHAGGASPDGETYTNSLEALNFGYANGHRLFEIDYSWTADRHLVALHDWRDAFRKLFSSVRPERLPLTRDAFSRLQDKKGNSPLSFHDVDVWLSEHPGALVVTDIKSHNPTGLRYIADEARDVGRYIPQIYAKEEYPLARELGYADVILTLYRTRASNADVLLFASKHPLFAVTMWGDRARRHGFAQQLFDNGVRVYAHTINDCRTFGELRAVGVYGVYTDFLGSKGDTDLCLRVIK